MNLKTGSAARDGASLLPLLGLALASAIGVVAYLVSEVLQGEAIEFDSTLILALRRPDDPGSLIGPSWLLQSAIDISALGGATLLWLLGGAATIFLVYIRRRTEAACLAASVVGASVLNLGLKSVFHRARPDLVPQLIDVTHASFPSGHAMISAAIYLTIGVSLAETQPRPAARAFLISFCVLLVVLIGASRVLLGVHWPSDVLAGWCLGAIWAVVVLGAERLIRRRLVGRALQHVA
jgi:undecaprenyl-diphosphatase